MDKKSTKNNEPNPNNDDEKGVGRAQNQEHSNARLEESSSIYFSAISLQSGPSTEVTKYVSLPETTDEQEHEDHEVEQVVNVQKLSSILRDPYSDTSDAVPPAPEKSMPRGRKRRQPQQTQTEWHTPATTSDSEDLRNKQERFKGNAPGSTRRAEALLESDAQPAVPSSNVKESANVTNFDRPMSTQNKVSQVRMNLDLNSANFQSKLQTDLKPGASFIFIVRPPDGGYGWFIMLISFLSQMVVDGIIFSVGITLPYMAEDFNLRQSQVVLIPAMLTGFYFLSGPLSSALINSYGFRPVALLGSSIASISMLIATFMPDEITMIIFYSIIGGAALSMVWVSSQLIIGYYFEKYRPVANGISCSGAGAGILLFSAMNGALVPYIGWRNMSRVHICFLCIVFLMVFTYIEVKPTLIGQYPEKERLVDSESSDQFDEIGSYTFSIGTPTVSKPPSSVAPALAKEKLKVAYDSTEIQNEGCIRTFLGKCCPRLAKKLRDKERITDLPLGGKGYIIQPDPMERKDLFYTGPAEYDSHGRAIEVLDQLQIQLGKETTHEQARSASYMLYMYAARPLKTPPRKVLSRFSLAYWVHPKIRNAFSLLFDFRLLRMREFQILLASAFLFPMGFNIPFVYSKDRAEIPGIYAVLVPSAIGFSNFLFRIISGFAAYKYKEYTTYICGSGITFGGMFVFISAFYGADVIWFQFFYAICFGVAPAFYSTLRAIIYVRTLGLDKLTNAFGLTAMSMGLGVFIGTTMGGILNQNTGSYNASFIFSGICIMTAGILKLSLSFLLKR